MFKMDLEKAEEQDIKLPTTIGSKKKQGNSRKPSICFIDYTKAFVWITTNWKIFKETEIPDLLACLLRNLHTGKEMTVRYGHGTTDWFQIGKGVH